MAIFPTIMVPFFAVLHLVAVLQSRHGCDDRARRYAIPSHDPALTPNGSQAQGRVMTRRVYGGRVAVVTGAGRGIGRAVAERLSADGATVVVNYARSQDAAQALVAAIHDRGGRAAAVKADVGRVDQVRLLFAEVDQVQHQLHPVGLLRGDHAEPALVGAVGGAGLDLQAHNLGVEPLGLVLVVDDDAGQTDAHRPALPWSSGQLAIPGDAGLPHSGGPWLAAAHPPSRPALLTSAPPRNSCK
jgi:hypothetical protein